MTETIVWSGKIFDLIQQKVEVAPWKIKLFERARRAPWVRMIIEQEWKILLTKEFRHELGRTDMRLPWGKVFDKRENYVSFLAWWENIETEVKRAVVSEAKEEVWIKIKDMKILWKRVCWATVEWDLWYVIVSDFSVCGEWLEDEEIESFSWYSREEVRAMLEDGSIGEWRSVSVLLQYISWNL